MKTYNRWEDIKKNSLSPEQIAEIDRAVQQEILEMNLKKLRQVLGKSQKQVAELAQMTQSQLSKTEGGKDHLISTLRRFVEALGGELEVMPNLKIVQLN